MRQELSRLTQYVRGEYQAPPDEVLGMIRAVMEELQQHRTRSLRLFEENMNQAEALMKELASA